MMGRRAMRRSSEVVAQWMDRAQHLYPSPRRALAMCPWPDGAANAYASTNAPIDLQVACLCLFHRAVPPQSKLRPSPPNVTAGDRRGTGRHATAGGETRDGTAAVESYRSQRASQADQQVARDADASGAAGLPPRRHPHPSLSAVNCPCPTARHRPLATSRVFRLEMPARGHAPTDARIMLCLCGCYPTGNRAGPTRLHRRSRTQPPAPSTYGAATQARCQAVQVAQHSDNPRSNNYSSGLLTFSIVRVACLQ